MQFFNNAILQNKLAGFGLFPEIIKENIEIIRQTTIENSQSSQNNAVSIEKRLWLPETTRLLIQLYEEHQDHFDNGIRKHAWQKVSLELNKKLNLHLTWQQCDTKWKGLVKTYKDIKTHNNTSGNNFKQWEYYNVMDKLLFKKPEISPVATCSSNVGLVINSQLVNEEEKENTPNNTDPNSVQKYQSSFKKKRSTKINPIERRHRERMERQDRFLDIFERIARSLENQNS